MNVRKWTASLALAAVFTGAAAMPALAQGKGRSDEAHERISEKFHDMEDFNWGLSHVVKMQVKGIFKGRGASLFAPGAKITRQEAAVATVRLMDKEADANALTAAEVDLLLKGVPDQATIATWARNAAAYLVKAKVISETEAFGPMEDATRLYVAVELVKALGYDAEAQAKMTATLEFKDATSIPENMVGYVAVAVDHKLITGYEDRTFKPEKAVKRVEMAVMMGRADGLIQRVRADEVKGIVKSVNAANSSITITSRGQDVTLTLVEGAAVFVDETLKALTDVVSGMKVEAELTSDGKVMFLEAKTPDAEDGTTPTPQTTASGAIAVLTAATATTPAKISLTATSGTTTTTTEYTLDAAAVLKINGAAVTFANLAVGDQATLTIVSGKVTAVAVTRTAQVSGRVSVIVTVGQNTPATITLNVTSGTTETATTYTVDAAASYKVNGQTAQFADLRVGDSATLTVVGQNATAVEVVRPVAAGLIAALTPATAAAAAQVALGSIVGGAFQTTTYSLPADASITLNGQAAQFADLHVNDFAKATLVGSAVIKVEVTR